ncbi:unnamed protein product, partial [Prorocentrum cordatum]
GARPPRGGGGRGCRGRGDGARLAARRLGGAWRWLGSLRPSSRSSCGPGSRAARTGGLRLRAPGPGALAAAAPATPGAAAPSASAAPASRRPAAARGPAGGAPAGAGAPGARGRRARRGEEVLPALALRGGPQGGGRAGVPARRAQGRQPEAARQGRGPDGRAEEAGQRDRGELRRERKRHGEAEERLKGLLEEDGRERCGRSTRRSAHCRRGEAAGPRLRRQRPQCLAAPGAAGAPAPGAGGAGAGAEAGGCLSSPQAKLKLVVFPPQGRLPQPPLAQQQQPPRRARGPRGAEPH